MDLSPLEKELGGRKFKTVKNGLDPAEVLAYINTLKEQIKEQATREVPKEHDNGLAHQLEHLDSLVSSLVDQFKSLAPKLESATKPAEGAVSESPGGKMEHLDSLTRFAEKTIIEAEKQAEIIKQEIAKEADATANAIIAEAEEKARAQADRIIAESGVRAEQKAQEAFAAAEHQVQDIIREADGKAGSIKEEAKEEANRIIAEAKQSIVAAKQNAKDIIKEAEGKGEGIKSDASVEAQ